MKKTTHKTVQKRMAKMGVTGFSSMANFTPDQHMAHLNELQRIRDLRKRAAVSRCKASRGHWG